MKPCPTFKHELNIIWNQNLWNGKSMLCVGEHRHYSGTCFPIRNLNPLGFIFHSCRQFSNTIWHSWAASSVVAELCAARGEFVKSSRGNNSRQSFMTSQNVENYMSLKAPSREHFACSIPTAQQFLSFHFRTKAKFSPFTEKKGALHIHSSTMPSDEIIFHYYANYHENMVEIIFGTLPGFFFS